MNIIRVKQLSLESQLDGKQRKELELMAIARLDDPSKLMSLGLSVEPQEQYCILKPNGQIRVRKTPNAFILTTKHWTPGVEGKQEAEIECSQAQFECFKKICDSGMIKDRYHYPLPNGLTLEIDLFKDLQGNLQPYVKMDLEYPPELNLNGESLKSLIPDLGFTEIFTKQHFERTEQEAKWCAEIFGRYFTVKP